MTVKPLAVVLPAVALLAACGKSAPTNDSRSASGEVLQGTISDAMLPVDQVRSEPPLEDPKAFAKAQTGAEGTQGGTAPEGAASETADAAPAESDGATPAATPAPEPAN